MEYNRFILKGKFDHSKEIIVQPRARLDKSKPGGGLFASRNLQNGAWIITPLKLTGRNYSVLVNRGWIPKHKLDQKKRPESLVEDEVTLIGILRLTEKVRDSFFICINVASMSHQCGLLVKCLT